MYHARVNGRGPGQRRWATLATLVSVMWIPGCRDGDGGSPPDRQPQRSASTDRVVRLSDVHEVEPAIASGSQAPNLSVGADGSIVASWIQPSSSALRWRRLEDGRWTEASTIVETSKIFVNWADVPTVTVDPQGRIVAVWLEEGEHGYGAKWSISADEGKTWSEPKWLSEDQSGPEYGFVSHAVTPLSQLALFWLDGRAASGHHGGQMQLRSAILDASGDIVARELISGRVCDCCQTDATATPSGPVVAFRDRSRDEIRDITVAGSGLEHAIGVGQDRWKIAGCPVNGPAIASRDERLAVAWFTAASGTEAVKVAFSSTPSERTDKVGAARLQGPRPFFADPVRVDLGRPVGRVDLVWGDADEVVVAWVEDAAEKSDPPEGAKLLVRRVARDGTLGPPAVVTSTTAAPASGFPRMARAGGQLVVMWTQVEGRPGVRLSELPLASIPR